MSEIEQLKDAFARGQITKADFIREMHGVHQRLFDYAKILKDTDISEIEIVDDSVIMTTRELGIKIFCDQYDERIIPLEIINFGEFEGDELRAMRKLLKNEWTIFDIGANIGWYSLNFAKNFADSKIVAFEPVPSTYKYLVSNLALNDVKNVEVHNIGLSNEEGTKEMYVYREGMGNASLSDLSEREGVEKILAEFDTLDAFVSKHNAKPDFIKCDVEGAELFVFQGAIETLTRDKPLVFTEILRKWSAKFNYHPNDVIDLFKSLGYLCYTIEKDGPKRFGQVDEQTLATNYLFAHADRISEYGLN